ncbi:hypothetical protein SCHPADRAFT_935186 [Schizopora paradoxa]|uniref:Uncharacterized protein n=1 Tax=Schizopora paradoxa TaxID=27342 RepID=A0A0H2SD66_9AGAM|nr:hypothetical protein SCHPADRAFT_935186 [Schizopora paradoxa]
MEATLAEIAKTSSTVALSGDPSASSLIREMNSSNQPNNSSTHGASSTTRIGAKHPVQPTSRQSVTATASFTVIESSNPSSAPAAHPSRSSFFKRHVLVAEVFIVVGVVVTLITIAVVVFVRRRRAASKKKNPSYQSGNIEPLSLAPRGTSFASRFVGSFRTNRRALTTNSLTTITSTADGSVETFSDNLPPYTTTLPTNTTITPFIISSDMSQFQMNQLGAKSRRDIGPRVHP